MHFSVTDTLITAAWPPYQASSSCHARYQTERTLSAEQNRDHEPVISQRLNITWTTVHKEIAMAEAVAAKT
ncbi:hypothetical protein E2C01_083656 [Portunus trituberculatus]|uniref:Uncharacterized protein n=1 Tax=Portunus trituberculatus TaxID=210409 RepID=A0A5B7J5F8_PORTR|nr:hypothetical protein [Portunus trituberculatus]